MYSAEERGGSEDYRLLIFISLHATPFY